MKKPPKKLYSHELLGLIEKTQKNTIKRIPEQLIPKRFSITRSIPDTKGCQKCDHVKNNGEIFLAAATQNHIILLQWHEPLRRFMILKQVEVTVPDNSPFRLIVRPRCHGDQNQGGELPSVLIAVNHAVNQNVFPMHIVDMNRNGPYEFSLPDAPCLPIKIVNQLEYDTILIGYDKCVKIISKKGKLKPTRKLRSEITFDFEIDDAVCLPDSVLGFHKHGLQGRSYKDESVTQELNDPNKVFKLLCGKGVIVLETKTTSSDTSDIWLVTGCY